MIQLIKAFFENRKLRKEKKRLETKISYHSSQCISMEMASDTEWEELKLSEAYEKERSILDQLRNQLNQIK